MHVVRQRSAIACLPEAAVYESEIHAPDHPHAARPLPAAGDRVSYEKLGFTLEDRRDDWGWAKLCWGDCQDAGPVDQREPGTRRAARCSYSIPTTSASSMRRRGRTGWTCWLETTFYGMREFRIDDPDGNRLWIGQVEVA